MNSFFASKSVNSVDFKLKNFYSVRRSEDDEEEDDSSQSSKARDSAMSGSSHAEEKKLSKEEEEVQLFKVDSLLNLMVMAHISILNYCINNKKNLN